MDDSVHLVQDVTSESMSAAIFDRHGATVFDRQSQFAEEPVQMGGELAVPFGHRW
jgi:hypothetical protein